MPMIEHVSSMWLGTPAIVFFQTRLHLNTLLWHHLSASPNECEGPTANRAFFFSYLEYHPRAVPLRVEWSPETKKPDRSRGFFDGT
jgi:hypothetical protein